MFGTTGWGLCSQPLPWQLCTSLQLTVRCATLAEALALAVRHYRLLLRDITSRLQHATCGRVVVHAAPAAR